MIKNLLIVDDEPRVAQSIERILRKQGYRIFIASSGRDGLEVIKNNDIGVVLSDLMMPEMDGLTFFEYIKHNNDEIVQILMTGFASLENALSAINRLNLFGYIKKPWTRDGLVQILEKAFKHHNLIVENQRLQEITKRQNHELKEINENMEDMVRQRTLMLEEAVREGVSMLAAAGEAKDDDAGEHIYRLQSLVFDICKKMGLPLEQADKISFFSLMHDIGKIQIPERILEKTGELTESEKKIMETHTIAGERILGVKPFYETARQITRSHHENWDGTGYPDGLRETEIPLPARIVAIADAYDAFRHRMPYRKAWGMEKVLNEMKNLSGKKFDPDILAKFLELINEKTRQKTRQHNGK